jgi:hypothetical protein
MVITPEGRFRLCNPDAATRSRPRYTQARELAMNILKCKDERVCLERREMRAKSRHIQLYISYHRTAGSVLGSITYKNGTSGYFLRLVSQ